MQSTLETPAKQCTKTLPLANALSINSIKCRKKRDISSDLESNNGYTKWLISVWYIRSYAPIVAVMTGIAIYQLLVFIFSLAMKSRSLAASMPPIKMEVLYFRWT